MSTPAEREAVAVAGFEAYLSPEKPANHFLERAKTYQVRSQKYGNAPEPVSSSRRGSKGSNADASNNSQQVPGSATSCPPSYLMGNLAGELLKPLAILKQKAAEEPSSSIRRGSGCLAAVESVPLKDAWSTNELPLQSIVPNDSSPVSSRSGPSTALEGHVKEPGHISEAMQSLSVPHDDAMEQIPESPTSPSLKSLPSIVSGSTVSSRKRVSVGEMVKPAREKTSESLSETLRLDYASKGKESRSMTTNGPLRHFVDSPWFTTSAIMVVILHSLFLAFDTNYDLGVGIGSVAFVGDAIFTAIYILEMVSRLAAYRQQYFQNSWNLLDLALAILSVADLIVVAAMNTSDPSLSVVTSLRMLRLLRLARLVRLFRFFKSLWLLVCGLATSLRTVSWAWLLIGLVIYIFGLCFTRIFAPYTCELSGDSNEELQELDTYFGNVWSAFFTVFQVITLEDWTLVAENAAVYEPWTRVLFILILATCTWGVMHVITAVFVESSLEASSVRSFDISKKAKEDYQRSCQLLCEIFSKADEENKGSLSKEEYLKVLDKPEFHDRLISLGIDRNTAEKLFETLDLSEQGPKRLNNAEFVEGILRCCGPAQNKDLVSLRCDVWRVEVRLQDELEKACQFINERVQQTTANAQALKEEAGPLLRQARSSLQSQQQSKGRVTDSSCPFSPVAALPPLRNRPCHLGHMNGQYYDSTDS